jgi:hypothetical protein
VNSFVERCSIHATRPAFFFSPRVLARIHLVVTNYKIANFFILSYFSIKAQSRVKWEFSINHCANQSLIALRASPIRRAISFKIYRLHPLRESREQEIRWPSKWPVLTLPRSGRAQRDRALVSANLRWSYGDINDAAIVQFRLLNHKQLGINGLLSRKKFTLDKCLHVLRDVAASQLAKPAYLPVLPRVPTERTDLCWSLFVRRARTQEYTGLATSQLNKWAASGCHVQRKSALVRARKDYYK